MTRRFYSTFCVLGIVCAVIGLAYFIGCSEDTEGPDPQVDVDLGPTIRSSDGALMLLIDGGEFTMGDPNAPAGSDSLPAHAVYISDFYMDETEVTNRLYGEFLSATRRPAPLFWDDPSMNQPDQPVVGVTWNDAAAYANWAGKRLPTEAEWEKAARGELSGALYPWGSDAPTGDRAIFNAAAPLTVGLTLPNGYGLYDTAGNVWEWCSDWYDPTYYTTSAKTDPRGPLFGGTRVVRGGSFVSDAMSLQVAGRSQQSPNEATAVTGFRCAKSAF